MMFHHMSCGFGPKQWTANCSFTFFRSTVTDMIVKWLLHCCLPDVKPVYWLVPKKRQRSYSNVGSIFHCSCHFGVHHWSLAYSRICCATSRMPRQLPVLLQSGPTFGMHHWQCREGSPHALTCQMEACKYFYNCSMSIHFVSLASFLIKCAFYGI